MNWGNVSHSLLLKLLAFVAWLRALSISGRARNRTSALGFLCLLYFPQMALYKGNINNKQTKKKERNKQTNKQTHKATPEMSLRFTYYL